jgi:hypothetical protein
MLDALLLKLMIWFGSVKVLTLFTLREYIKMMKFKIKILIHTIIDNRVQGTIMLIVAMLYG